MTSQSLPGITQRGTTHRGQSTNRARAEQGASVEKRLAIVGSGAIACGLAATAAHHGPVLLLARSDRAAERARGWSTVLGEWFLAV